MSKYDGLPREELLRLCRERYDGVINVDLLSDRELIEKLENFDRFNEATKGKEPF